MLLLPTTRVIYYSFPFLPLPDAIHATVGGGNGLAPSGSPKRQFQWSHRPGNKYWFCVKVPFWQHVNLDVIPDLCYPFSQYLLTHTCVGIPPGQVEPTSPIELTTSRTKALQARRSCASSLETFTQSFLSARGGVPGLPYSVGPRFACATCEAVWAEVGR